MQSGTHQADDKLCDELLNGSQSGALLCQLLLVEPNDWHAEVTHPDIDIKLSHQSLPSRFLLQVWRGVCCAHATAVTDIMQTRENAEFA